MRKHNFKLIWCAFLGFASRKEANVMGRLADIAHELIRKTGIFCSDLPYANQKMSTVLGFESFALNGKCLLQTGIIRVNCVDCLDRTNTAQFALGKCALGYQVGFFFHFAKFKKLYPDVFSTENIFVKYKLWRYVPWKILFGISTFFLVSKVLKWKAYEHSSNFARCQTVCKYNEFPIFDTKFFS